MVERKTIGLLFSVTEGWIGGTYYFLNIIAALNNLSDEEKPLLLIYSSDTSGYEAALKTGYPYLKFKSSVFTYSLIERIINKCSRILLKKNLITKGLSKMEMPVLFGYYEQLLIHKCEKKKYWIPDFQEHYYPEYIGKEVTLARKKIHLLLIRQKAELVFSSNTALKDFQFIYSNNQCKTSIVKFAVTHPDFSSVNFLSLQKKYNFSDKYFFTPNQFWAHKNHLIVLKAIAHLKNQGISIQFVFSGKYNENEQHVKELFNYIKTHQLEANVLFLGFIPREEQLTIMQHAIAVVQPSFFEGWSTVVEDAKALHKTLILSDIEVHKEQTNQVNCSYFSPFDYLQLANHLEKNYKSQHLQGQYVFDYNESRKGFARSFLSAF